MADIDGRDPGTFDFQNIVYEKSGRRAKVTINRPEVLNCVDLATLRELQTAFQDASWDDGVTSENIMGFAGNCVHMMFSDVTEESF